MKLLRDFDLLRFARRLLAARRSSARAVYRVTVPAPRPTTGDHAAHQASHRNDGHERPALRTGGRRSSSPLPLAARQ
jgi:hypothetical protein